MLSLSPASHLAAIVGNGIAGSLGDGGSAAQAQLHLESSLMSQRSGLAIALDGTIFIADTGNSSIRRVASSESSEPGIIRSVAGRWAPPQKVALSEPLGLAVDSADNLFIADHANDSVLELRGSTGELETVAHIVRPASVASALDGRIIFVAAPDAGQVFAIDMATRTPRVAVSAIEAAIEPASQPAKGVPSGLAVDGAGNLFVSFANLNRIYRVPVAAPATPAIFASDLHSPGDLAFDSAGNLFVADQGQNRILEFVGAGVAAPPVSLTPSSFDFGNEPTGGTSASEMFTLANNSGAMLTGISIGFQGGNAGDFKQSGTSCVSTLATGSTCTINVALTPSATGARSSSLTVTSSAPMQQSAVSGTGDDYELSLAPSQIESLTVAAGNSVTYNLQVTNDAVFTGSVTLECPGNLPAATFCTLTPATAMFTAPSQTVPFTIMLQTTSRTKVPGTEVPPTLRQPRGPSSPLPYPALLVIAVLLLLFIAANWNRNRRSAAILGLSALAFAGILAGCHHKSLSINGTPAGTSDLIVQGTAQNASRGVHIQLVVQ